MRRITALLDTRFDYLPTVRSSMPDSDHKPANSRTVPCGVCHGRGRLSYGKGKPRRTRLCLGCDGTGERRRRAGDPDYDMNLAPGHRRLTVNGRARGMTAREYDEELARIKADQDSRAGRVDHERYGWEKAREARDLAGSYQRLDAAVRLFRSRYPGCSLTGEGSLELLSNLMGPRTIRVPAAVQAELAERRRHVALELHRLGWTAGAIGRGLGISREKVGRMLKEKPHRPKGVVASARTLPT